MPWLQVPAQTSGQGTERQARVSAPQGQACVSQVQEDNHGNLQQDLLISS